VRRRAVFVDHDFVINGRGAEGTGDDIHLASFEGRAHGAANRHLAGICFY
jgi:hypothetical protein